MLRAARSQLASFGGKYRLLTTGRLEHGSVRGMDEVAEDLAKRHPHAFHERAHLSEQLHDMLVAGNPRPMSEEDVYDQALAHLVEVHQRELEAVPFQTDRLPHYYDGRPNMYPDPRLHGRPQLFSDPCVPCDARAVSDELQNAVNHALAIYIGENFPHLDTMHAKHAAKRAPARPRTPAGTGAACHTDWGQGNG
jgi:hypothetical protein